MSTEKQDTAKAREWLRTSDVFDRRWHNADPRSRMSSEDRDTDLLEQFAVYVRQPLEQKIAELEGRIEAIIAPAEVGGGIVADLTAENERLKFYLLRNPKGHTGGVLN
jgi:hypothetical protein